MLSWLKIHLFTIWIGKWMLVTVHICDCYLAVWQVVFFLLFKVKFDWTARKIMGQDSMKLKMLLATAIPRLHSIIGQILAGDRSFWLANNIFKRCNQKVFKWCNVQIIFIKMLCNVLTRPCCNALLDFWVSCVMVKWWITK